ncbi:MAG: cyclic nucleotide-binding domain-containing protein [Anderseniella sp.]|jgi:CRP-like cAMP-binding protein|nr:cyclic nucleotide-binding domain-containing protein [Anderseniella sp.]
MQELFADLDTFNTIGIVGVSLYIANYTALQTGFVHGQGYVYPTVCLIAASCVLASLMQDFNLSSAVIQITWIAISIVGITRMYVLGVTSRFSDQERKFIRHMATGLAEHRVRALLHNGIWLKADPGTVLTREGQPVDHLSFVASGMANVIVGGKTIATSGAGMAIGEITYLSGEPATATVEVAEQMHLIRFEADKLRAFLQKNQDIGAVLEQNMANHLRSKLVSMSETASQAPAPASAKSAAA